jgi:hypothetical protein
MRSMKYATMPVVIAGALVLGLGFGSATAPVDADEAPLQPALVGELQSAFVERLGSDLAAARTERVGPGAGLRATYVAPSDDAALAGELAAIPFGSALGGDASADSDTGMLAGYRDATALGSGLRVAFGAGGDLASAPTTSRFGDGVAAALAGAPAGDDLAAPAETVAFGRGLSAVSTSEETGRLAGERDDLTVGFGLRDAFAPEATAGFGDGLAGAVSTVGSEPASDLASCQ